MQLVVIFHVPVTELKPQPSVFNNHKNTSQCLLMFVSNGKTINTFIMLKIDPKQKKIKKQKQ